VHFIDYTLLIITALGSGLLFLLFKPNANTLKLLLTFSGAYLFCLTAIHLLPELYSNGNTLKSGVFIVIGFVLQIILEFFTQGLEHGHIHLPHHKHHSKHSAHSHTHHHSSVPFVMITGLSIHAFLEGMPLSCSYQGIIHLKINPLLAGILLHNLPIAYTFMNMLVASGLSKIKAIFWLLFFSLMTPLGSAFSWFLQEGIIVNLENYYSNIMAIVIGIFLHISTTILFESSANHRFNLLKIITVLAGAATAVFFEII